MSGGPIQITRRSFYFILFLFCCVLYIVSFGWLNWRIRSSLADYWTVRTQKLVRLRYPSCLEATIIAMTFSILFGSQVIKLLLVQSSVLTSHSGKFEQRINYSFCSGIPKQRPMTRFQTILDLKVFYLKEFLRKKKNVIAYSFNIDLNQLQLFIYC